MKETGSGSARCRTADEGRYLEPDIELMDRVELDALQEQRVLAMLPRVYESSALYRSAWDAAGVRIDEITTITDFKERIPFLTKDTVRGFRDRTGDPFGGLLCRPRAELSAVMCSSGTTGDPTLFAERFSMWSPLQTGRVRDLWEHGLRPGDHAIPAPNALRGASAHDLRQLGCIPVAIDSGAGCWRDVLKVVERYDVRYLVWLGPYLRELEQLAEEIDLRRALEPVKVISFAGEPLGRRMQRRIREEWGTALAIWTSAGDTGTAWECREHDGCHLWEDTVFPECVTPGGVVPVEEGDIGELVVTDIDNEVAPLIRYRSDDLVRLTRDICRCGRTHARIWPLGRGGDLTVVGGRGVMPADLWPLVERHDETRAAIFQVVRPSAHVDTLRIRIGYDVARTRSVAELRDRLTSDIAASLNIVPEVELVEEQDLLARGWATAKIPRVVPA